MTEKFNIILPPRLFLTNNVMTGIAKGINMAMMFFRLHCRDDAIAILLNL